MGYYNKELNDINFQIIECSQILKPYIYSYWTIQKKDIKKPIIHKFLSDTSMGIIINFKSDYEITVNKQIKNCTSKFVVDGPTKYPSYLRFENDLDIIGIRFNPAGSFVFFDEDIDTFTNNHKILQNSSSWQIDDLYKSLLNTNTIEDKTKLLDDFLIKKLLNSKKTNTSWLFDFIKRINTKKGDINLLSLCKEFNISIRQLERKFKQEVGLSPKLYSRIIRLRHVKGELSSLEIPDLTTTAYETGFFDQAHFTKEFKFFMNETPKNYLENKRLEAKKHDYKKYLTNRLKKL